MSTTDRAICQQSFDQTSRLLFFALEIVPPGTQARRHGIGILLVLEQLNPARIYPLHEALSQNHCRSRQNPGLT